MSTLLAMWIWLPPRERTRTSACIRRMTVLVVTKTLRIVWSIMNWQFLFSALYFTISVLLLCFYSLSGYFAILHLPAYLRCINLHINCCWRTSTQQRLSNISAKSQLLNQLSLSLRTRDQLQSIHKIPGCTVAVVLWLLKNALQLEIKCNRFQPCHSP